MKRVSNNDFEIILLDGVIDQDKAIELDALLNELTNEQKYKILIDMINVKRICSGALGVLVATKRMITDKDGDIKLVITDDSILKIFQTTMLDKVFEIYESTRECVNIFD
ncbi:MAG: STAS domain-containing protein [Spirochaetota bacterium]|nr:STAS domain-containing protein [Spirochaetota bacterium]